MAREASRGLENRCPKGLKGSSPLPSALGTARATRDVTLCSKKEAMPRTDSTIDQVLDDFLSVQRDRVKVSTAKRYEEVLDYFRACMDGYGHQWLSETESDLFEYEHNRDEEAGSSGSPTKTGRVAR